MIPESIVQEVLDTAKIEEVVEDFVPLKRRGVNMLGLCPFHNEKTPSFTVAPSKGIFKCFGCGESGNAIGFVMKHEQISFVQAVKYLGKKYNIEIPEREISPKVLAEQQEADALYLSLDYAQNYYSDLLWQNDFGKTVGLGYFKSRGFHDEIIKLFGLGFADGRSDDFSKAAQKAHYKPDVLKEASLMTESERDFFRQRVLFPVYNLSGKVVGFGGRILTEDKKQPKYLNTRESKVYQKSRLLYGIFQAKKAIMQADNCYMVEGYTDVLALHQGGIANVVASSGTSLTVEQILLIKRFTPNMTILYDGDAAGIKAALRGLDLVLEQDMNVKVVLLPAGQDPDSYIQKLGGQGFKDFLEAQAKDFILFKTQLLIQESENDPLAKAELINNVIESITRIPNPIKRSTYIQTCAKVLAISEDLIYSEMNKKLAKLNQRKQQQEQYRPQAQSDNQVDLAAETATFQHQKEISIFERGDQVQEWDFIRVLIRFGSEFYDKNKQETIADFMFASLDELKLPLHQLFQDTTCAQIAEIYLRKLSEDEIIDEAFFTKHESPAIAQLAINLCFFPHEYSSGWEKRNLPMVSQVPPEDNFVLDAESCLKRFKFHKINRLLDLNRELIRRAQQEGADWEQLLSLGKAQLELEKRRNELSSSPIVR